MRPICLLTTILINSALCFAQNTPIFSPEYTKILTEYENAKAVPFEFLEGKIFFGQCYNRSEKSIYADVLAHAFRENLSPINSKKYAIIIYSLVGEYGFMAVSHYDLRKGAADMRAQVPGTLGPIIEQEDALIVPGIGDIKGGVQKYRVNDKSHLVILAEAREDFQNFKKGDITMACYLYLSRPL